MRSHWFAISGSLSIPNQCLSFLLNWVSAAEQVEAKSTVDLDQIYMKLIDIGKWYGFNLEFHIHLTASQSAMPINLMR